MTQHAFVNIKSIYLPPNCRIKVELFSSELYNTNQKYKRLTEKGEYCVIDLVGEIYVNKTGEGRKNIWAKWRI